METLELIWLDLIDQITIHPNGQHRSKRPVNTVQQYVYVDTKKER